MNKNDARSGALFFELLAVLFIGLKLTHVITWSWWWVLAPIWAPTGAILLAISATLAWAFWKERN